MYWLLAVPAGAVALSGCGKKVGEAFRLVVSNLLVVSPLMPVTETRRRWKVEERWVEVREVVEIQTGEIEVV